MSGCGHSSNVKGSAAGLSPPYHATRRATDENKATVHSYDYSAFGTITAETGALENPFAYTAREYDDESGLYYYRARYYDAGVGRFLGRDPLADPIHNLFIYARNNPINFTDPSGTALDWKCYIACKLGFGVGCNLLCFAACMGVAPYAFPFCYYPCVAVCQLGSHIFCTHVCTIPDPAPEC